MLPTRLSEGAYKLEALPPSRNRALGKRAKSDVKPFSVVIPDLNPCFTVTAPRELMSRTLKARKRSVTFKFAVFDRYRPAKCCVCGIQVPELLDAAHIVGVEHDGTDDPRNGLVFCATHHRNTCATTLNDAIEGL